MRFAHARARSYTGMAISCVDLISVCRMHFLGHVISPQGSVRGCHESRRLYHFLTPHPHTSTSTSTQPFLLQWTITGSPAGHGGSGSHSWLRSWLRLPIGCHRMQSRIQFAFFSLGFFWCCSTVFWNFVKMIESLLWNANTSSVHKDWEKHTKFSTPSSTEEKEKPLVRGHSYKTEI